MWVGFPPCKSSFRREIGASSSSLARGAEAFSEHKPQSPPSQFPSCYSIVCTIMYATEISYYGKPSNIKKKEWSHFEQNLNNAIIFPPFSDERLFCSLGYFEQFFMVLFNGIPLEGYNLQSPRIAQSWQ